MLKGLYLTLLVGPVVPLPMPQVVMEALTGVTVKSNTEGTSGFDLSFTLSNRSPLHTIFLLAAGNTPLLRVILIVTINGSPQVMMDGVTTMVQVTPGSTPGQSTLTVTGNQCFFARVAALIDLECFRGATGKSVNPRCCCRLARTVLRHHQHRNVILRQLTDHRFDGTHPGANAFEPNTGAAGLRYRSNSQAYVSFEIHTFLLHDLERGQPRQRLIQV